jgi:hypothetical protein
MNQIEIICWFKTDQIVGTTKAKEAQENLSVTSAMDPHNKNTTKKVAENPEDRSNGI